MGGSNTAGYDVIIEIHDEIITGQALQTIKNNGRIQTNRRFPDDGPEPTKRTDSPPADGAELRGVADIALQLKFIRFAETDLGTTMQFSFDFLPSTLKIDARYVRDDDPNVQGWYFHKDLPLEILLEGSKATVEQLVTVQNGQMQQEDGTEHASFNITVDFRKQETTNITLKLNEYKIRHQSSAVILALLDLKVNKGASDEEVDAEARAIIARIAEQLREAFKTGFATFQPEVDSTPGIIELFSIKDVTEDENPSPTDATGLRLKALSAPGDYDILEGPHTSLLLLMSTISAEPDHTSAKPQLTMSGLVISRADRLRFTFSNFLLLRGLIRPLLIQSLSGGRPDIMSEADFSDEHPCALEARP